MTATIPTAISLSRYYRLNEFVARLVELTKSNDRNLARNAAEVYLTVTETAERGNWEAACSIAGV